MTLASVKTIRSLRRGLEVLRLLDRMHVASLEDLHGITGMPKPTLSRILLTLQDEGYASQRIADNKWVIGLGMSSLARRVPRSDRLVQAAAPAMNELCRRVIWPSDLSVRSGLRMVLKETSRPHSTLTLNRLNVNFQIDMLRSAPGRAYLAFCPDVEKLDLLRRIGARHNGDAAVDAMDMEAVIRETRRNGFGGRDPAWGGHVIKSRREYDDGLDAIAVPIIHEGKVLGCVNIVWIRKLVSRRSMVERHLDDLSRCARAITGRYVKLLAG